MQKITLAHSAYSDQQVCGDILITNSQKHIGTYEFYVNEESFVAAINIFTEFQNRGVGFFVFKSCFDLLNKKNCLKYFSASWSFDSEYSHLPNQQSINLTAFQNAISSGMDENKASWETPTGKWLKKIGFTAATVTQSDDKNVKVIFAIKG